MADDSPRVLGASMKPTGKRHSGLCINVDGGNVEKLERKLRKRSAEKEKLDALENNNHKTKMSQEDVVQSKQKKKKRKVTFNCNDATSDVDISKEDLNENIKTVKATPKSKRQLKKEKAERAEIEKKQTQSERSKSNAKQKALSYLSTWKHCRNEWKFEKLKQIWLMDNLLDENAISDDLFPVVLEYFEGCKGMAREVLMRKGMEIIRKAESETDEDSKRDIMKSIAYSRARQLLQTLPFDK
ncbi:uncharacterized protein C7orf50 homolog [Monomorium pharaonis]|uniref:uncharacterized protein C7orf50 homolog n=1 Tax=Monomorium pharaonis TaxID=307658 RepID=UPI001746DB44|nr:uncharacterized protein C7orf50 homolog [Monomorium pharaonis]